MYKANLNGCEITFDPCDFGKDAHFISREKQIAVELNNELHTCIEINGLGPSRPSVDLYALGILEDSGAEIVEWPEGPENVVY